MVNTNQSVKVAVIQAAREAGVYLVIGFIERDSEYSGGT